MVAQVTPKLLTYVSPFRIFEFGLGAIIIWIPTIKKAQQLEAISIVGLAAVFYGVFRYDETTPFPGLNALIPALGATLVIYGGSAHYTGQLLRNYAAVRLGEISYSVYLVHWPLIIFIEYLTAQKLAFPNNLFIGLASIVIGMISYRFVELRYWKGPQSESNPVRLVGRLAGIAALTAGVATSASIAGWPNRISNTGHKLAINSNEFHVNQFGGAGIKIREPIILGSNTSPPRFHIIGDSHALQYAFGLQRILLEKNISAKALFNNGCIFGEGITRYISGKEVESCSKMYSQAIKMIKDDDLPVYIIFSWSGYFNQIGKTGGGSPIKFKNFDEYYNFLIVNIDKMRTEFGRNRKYVIVGTVPGARRNSTLSAYDCIMTPQFVDNACRSKLEFPPNESNTRNFTKYLLEYGKGDYMISVVDPYGYLCDPNCKSQIEGNLIYSDGLHLSKDGSLYLVKKISETGLYFR